MTNFLRGGFHIIGGAAGRNVTRYPVVTNNGTAIFRGDAVSLTTAGVIIPATAGGAPLVVGIVSYVSYVDGGVRRERQHLPANTTYTPTARGSINESWVFVFDDPNAEYWATADANAGTDTEAEVWAAVGSNMDIVAGAGSTLFGQSAHTLDGNPIAGTAQMRIKNVRRIPGRQTDGTANLQYRVQINEGQHPFTSTAGI